MKFKRKKITQKKYYDIGITHNTDDDEEEEEEKTIYV